jgi:ribose transport system ATP-binding protein
MTPAALSSVPAADDASAGVVLAMRNISKRFGGTLALDKVDMDLRRGEILALLGENGAGKSTLIKILAGVHQPDEGEILFHGRKIEVPPQRLPIAFIHQDLGLIDWMTVSENICLSLGYPRRWGLVDFEAARRRAVEALAQLGADIDPDVRVEQLSRTEKSLVAISRALASNAEVIVLDEPTASLPADEVQRLFAAISRLRDSGVAMVYVSHRLDEVFEVARRMLVLRDGRVVGERAVAETSAQEAIMLIVGKEPSQVFRRAAGFIGETRLGLDGLKLAGVGPVTCAFRRGEVVGLVGLRGAGQERIAQALFGLIEPSGGRVMLDGRIIAPSSPRKAMAAGIELIWGDRSSGSIVPVLTVQENLFLNPIAGGLKNWSYMVPRQEADAARDLGRKVGLRPNRPELPIEALSGGNQQKVVIGRWLHLGGKVYVFEDPTAGVDVGAKADIYQLFNVALEAGAAIVIVSTDFEEVANVCHRALVFDRGRVVAELSGPELTVGALLAAASGTLAPGAVSPTVTPAAPAVLPAGMS